jgi:hypothetical protein
VLIICPAAYQWVIPERFTSERCWNVFESALRNVILKYASDRFSGPFVKVSSVFELTTEGIAVR